MVKVADLPSFDMAESLKTEEDIVMYLNMVLEENDPAELAHALGVIAKARGMTQIAKEAGIAREALPQPLPIFARQKRGGAGGGVFLAPYRNTPQCIWI